MNVGREHFDITSLISHIISPSLYVNCAFDQL